MEVMISRMITWPWLYQNIQTQDGNHNQCTGKHDNSKLWGFDLPPIVQIYADRCFNIPGEVLQDSNHKDHMLLYPTGSEKQRCSLEIQITDSKQVIFIEQTTPTTTLIASSIFLQQICAFIHKPTLHAVCLWAIIPNKSKSISSDIIFFAFSIPAVIRFMRSSLNKRGINLARCNPCVCLFVPPDGLSSYRQFVYWDTPRNSSTLFWCQCENVFFVFSHINMNLSGWCLWKRVQSSVYHIVRK